MTARPQLFAQLAICYDKSILKTNIFLEKKSK